MNDHYYRAISIDCIAPDVFPAVPLFMKTSGNYVLYKTADRQFTDADRSRMERTGTQFMYIRSGDMETMTGYLEDILKDTLAREDLDSARKGAVLYQASINFVIDAFEDPEQAANVERCRQLTKHMMQFVAKDPKALQSLNTVVSHNFYIFAHSTQVAALNLLAHERLFKVDPDELADVGIGSLLHDYGISLIASDVTKKADSLADADYFTIKRHAQKGYDFLNTSRAYSDVALTIVKHHHERYDGNGYPAAMKGDQIPRSAQVSALCDTYSTLTLEKPGRKGMSHDEAIKAMRGEAGKGFNPELLAGFIDLIGARQTE